ncbi:MAG: tRNA (adenosine(37)-N6)-threonylcarbamoyltransferase complex ATPase subunit type 1 TsaE [Actinomycetota bacterium]
MSTSPSPRGSRFFTIETRSPEETRRLGVALSPLLLPGDVIALAGDLGAGKTTFVQGLAAGLGVPERVTSPTFILMKEYLGGRYPLMHIDVYRLDTVQEVIDLGYDEFLDPSHIVVVEWGDVVEPLLPKDHLLVDIAVGDGDLLRRVTLSPRGSHWEDRMETVGVLASELFSVGREDEPEAPRGFDLLAPPAGGPGGIDGSTNGHQEEN